MAIVVTLDVVLAARRTKAKDLAQKMKISETQLSLFRTGKVKGIRFSTLAAMCEALDCQPGDLLAFDSNGVESGEP